MRLLSFFAHEKIVVTFASSHKRIGITAKNRKGVDIIYLFAIKLCNKKAVQYN